MKARITRSSDWSMNYEYKEFKTLEELLEYRKEVRHALIISGPSESYDFAIEIYDDYRE